LQALRLETRASRSAPASECAIKRVMEGGEAAFKLRKEKYGL
jgi:hypothetical protein